MAQTPNLVTQPQKGLVSTNLFGPQKVASGPASTGGFWGNLGNQIGSAFGLGSAQTNATNAANQAVNVTNQAANAGVKGSSLPQATTQNASSLSPFSSNSMKLNPSVSVPQPQQNVSQPQGGIIPVANAATGLGGGGSWGTQNDMTKQPVSDPSQSANPFSTQNYYAAHPDANPVNNTDASQTGATTQPTTTFPGLVNKLANTSSQTTSNFNQAQNTSGAAASDLLNSAPQQNADVLAQKNEIQNLTNQYSGAKGTMGAGTNLAEFGGEQGMLQNQYINNLTGLQAGLTNILQGNAQQQAAYTGAGNVANATAGAATSQQSTQQSGLNNAAGLISPTQVPYSNQYVSPMTGQPVNGGGADGTAMSQLPAQAQSAVQSYAQQVQNGSMTRADAEGRLSAYGIAGTNALNEALGSGFNTNASNASAGTTAVGQQIQTAATSTNKALDTLGSAFANLNLAQTAGIPATNSISNWIASQFGDAALQQYKTNLADARSQLIGVLNSSGGTPTGNEATANQYLPDNMTKQQFDQNVGTQQNPGIVRQLIQQKVSSFTGSGQQNGTTNTNSNTGGSQWSF